MSYTSAKSYRPSYTLDALLILKDGAVTVDGAGQVGGVARVLDVGLGLVEGEVVCDFATMVTAGGELYNVLVQGSNSPTFASGNTILASLPIGAGAAQGALGTNGSDVTDAAGRYVIGVRNEKGGTYYRYMRLWSDTTGAGASASFTAYLVPRNN